MRTVLISLVLVASAAPPLTSGCDPPAPVERDADPPQGKVKAKAIFVLLARMPKTTFKQGEPVELWLELKNTTDQTVVYWQCGFGPNHLIVVKTSRGDEAELTDEGRRLRAQFGRGNDASWGEYIAPGQSYRHGNRPFHLDRYYKLPPGAYTVQVTYSDIDGNLPYPGEVKVSSEPLDFTIIP